ncbi:MAG: hypothetical protein JWO26_2768 [Rhodospirillales bacterium]|nr:hypothetical protein [Rhodospirillales bacterium]
MAGPPQPPPCPGRPPPQPAAAWPRSPPPYDASSPSQTPSMGLPDSHSRRPTFKGAGQPRGAGCGSALALRQLLAPSLARLLCHNRVIEPAVRAADEAAQRIAGPHALPSLTGDDHAEQHGAVFQAHTQDVPERRAHAARAFTTDRRIRSAPAMKVSGACPEPPWAHARRAPPVRGARGRHPR